VKCLAKERDLQLLEYDISDNRYRELKYFCRQYKEKQQRLNAVAELSSPQFGGRRGSGFSDRTADLGIKKARLAMDIQLIEQTALETDGECYPFLIKNVTEGVPYEYLDIPFSRAGFYAIRRKFFFILDKKK